MMSEEMIDQTMFVLSQERSLQGIHLGGGECTLNFDRLEYAVQSAVKHRVALDYLETNAGWCVDDKTAVDGFKRLRKAGLSGVLISASLFHLEFIPLQMTLTAVRAASEVFGGSFVWTEEVLRLMKRLPSVHKKYPLYESCRLLNIDPGSGELWRIHPYLNPCGRAAIRLSDGLPRYPAERFQGDSCARTLQSTQHFHIDKYGNVFTGHCPGITVANIYKPHPTVTSQTAPFFMDLVQGGPFAFWKRYEKELQNIGFVPDPAGYIGKCHFCWELRRHLLAQGTLAEIAPAEVYRHA